tara:strand:- start:408 stop:812 length:405 start_codon:yes stop_codon:yes gene_type:complete
MLPVKYTCITTEIEDNYIIGPYIDFDSADMMGIEIDPPDLDGVFGSFYTCPILSQSLVAKGYGCSQNTNNHILGPNVNLDQVDLNSIENKLPQHISLHGASYHGNILIEENSNFCDSIKQLAEQSIGINHDYNV